MIRTTDAAIVLILFLMSFSIYSHLALEFKKSGVFAQIDVLFDADAGRPLIRHIAHGWASTNQIHPWFSHYYHPFVRAAERAVAYMGYGQSTPEATRFEIGLYCIPLTAALGVSAMYLVFRRLPLSVLESLALSGTGLVSFSNLIFGSIPDRFGTSGLFLTLTLLLSIQTITNRRRHWLLWVAVGCFSMGTTITQLLPVATLFMFERLFHIKNFRQSLLESILYCVVVCPIVSASTALIHYSARNPSNTERTISSTTITFLNESLSHKLEFYSAVPNAIAPSRFGVKLVPEVESKCNEYQLTLENMQSPVRSILIALIFVTGATAMIRSKIDSLRILGSGAALIVIENLLLHAFWGSEWVLYSQHWLSPSLVLLSGNLLFFGDNTKLRSLASFAVLILVAINNYFILNSILETLRQGSLCLNPSDVFALHVV